MFLTKRSNGYYYIIYERNGKRTGISTKTKYKSEAFKFFSNFENEIKKRVENKIIPISLREYMFVFFRYSETVHSPNTTETYKVTFKMLLNYLGDIPLTNLTHQILDLYFQERIRSVSIYVAQRDLSNISSFFNYAIKNGYALENPIKHFKRFKLPEKQPIFYTEKEFSLLINALEDEDLRDLAEFAVQTGLRQMELITLQWEQINLVNKNLVLDNRNSLTKSKKVRNVPLSSIAIKILEKRILIKSYGYVFTIRGNKINHNHISHIYKKYILKLPINPKLNFHSFRHTFASWLVQRGVSIYVVSRLLGHSDIKTTQIYAHLRSDDLLSAVETLNLS